MFENLLLVGVYFDGVLKKVNVAVFLFFNWNYILSLLNIKNVICIYEVYIV